jgi:pilus assembly protein CpaC
VDLNAARSWGFNFFSLPGSTTRTLGTTQTQQFGGFAVPSVNASSSGSAVSTLTTGSILNLFIFRPDINMGITMEALETHDLLQILAEPNLLTETGKKASFLAGGQFPFPVVQGGSAGSVPTVTVEFKDFGVRLNFTPRLTADGKIDLKVAPEVSSLDYQHALQLQGFNIPALSTRRVSTEMLLKNGQTFAIAGLLNNEVQRTMEKIPWLGDVPVIGKLFHSWSHTKSRSELLVLVTPHIVTPYGPGQAPATPKFTLPFMPGPTKLPPLGKMGQQGKK